MTDHFDRVPPAFRPVIGAARELLPASVLERVPARFLCGVDPCWVGLHSYRDTDDGRSYSDTAHACYPWHVANARPMIVLPNAPRCNRHGRDLIDTVLHEYGHILDWSTHFELEAPETTDYSRTSRIERIAEAFQLILRPPSEEWREYVGAEGFRPLRAAMGVA